jgi:hypothetical protein
MTSSTPLFQEQGGGRVPEVVEADAAEVGLAEERGEGAGEVGRVDRSALHRSEHVPVVPPRRARGLTLVLLLAVELQRLGTAGRQGDAALGGPGLGGQSGEPACASALKGAADGDGARAEVEVFLVQAENFALAESGVEGEFGECVQPVPAVRLGPRAGSYATTARIPLRCATTSSSPPGAGGASVPTPPDSPASLWPTGSGVRRLPRRRPRLPRRGSGALVLRKRGEISSGA